MFSPENELPTVTVNCPEMFVAPAGIPEIVTVRVSVTVDMFFVLYVPLLFWTQFHVSCNNTSGIEIAA